MITKIENTIFLKQGKIKELEKIIDNVRNSKTKKIRLRIETKHWYGFGEPFLAKCKNKINYEKETIIDILEKCISKEKEYIDKLIDMEIEERKRKDDN